MAEGLPLRRQLRRPGSPRSARHVVRVTAEQEARLIERAAADRVTIPRLLVESALQHGRTPPVSQVDKAMAAEVFGMSRLLGKIGVNVNQLAKATNATREVQPGTAAAIDAVSRVCGRLDDLADRLGGEPR